MTTKTVAALAASAALIASLAACGGSSNTIAPATSQAPAAAPATTAATQYSADFGGSVTFPEGVKVTVSQPTAMPAAETAAGAVEGKEVVVSLSVTNGSKTPFDAGAALMGYAKFSYGADGTDATSAIDSANGIGMGHLSTILPGETQTVKLGYGVPSAGFSQVRMEVTGPNEFKDQPAIFKGAVK